MQLSTDCCSESSHAPLRGTWQPIQTKLTLKSILLLNKPHCVACFIVVSVGGGGELVNIMILC